MIGTDRGRTYKVKVEDLLQHLLTNREKHAGIVEEAQQKFRELAIAKMEEILKDARNGRKIITRLGLRVPTSHIREYDTAVGILEMTKAAGEDTIEITAGEYERFVLDRWEWTAEFLSSNRGYITSLPGEEDFE